jgi:3-methyl-2-oxobutanoate hydroxymethyltransferase
MSRKPKPVRIPDIQGKKTRGEKITMLTAYTAWMARLLTEAEGVDMLLVGDSLGMVELGYDTTVPVTIEDMVRHTQAVRRGAPLALVVADMPFLTYHLDLATTLINAGRLIQEGGATAVKVEGGAALLPAVERMVGAGIPVMGHLGLTPQSVHVLGGFRRQARRPEEQARLLADAKALESAGAFAVVLECIPDEAGREVSQALRIPTIGIGSGADCDGQVLVTHDILGLTGPLVPAFAKHYAELGSTIRAAVQTFVSEVHEREFPPAAAEVGR